MHTFIIFEVLIILYDDVYVEFGEQLAQLGHQGTRIVSAALAQAQKVAEEASIMFLRNAMLRKDSVVCCEKCSEGGIWRLLRVGYDLEEDVDICASQSVLLITPIERNKGQTHLGHSKAATPQSPTSLAFGSCKDPSIDAFRFGRLYRRCVDGGDGIRAFLFFVNSCR